MDKTITVAVKTKVAHKKYSKIIAKTNKYYAHDANNECRIGLCTLGHTYMLHLIEHNRMFSSSPLSLSSYLSLFSSLFPLFLSLSLPFSPLLPLFRPPHPPIRLPRPSILRAFLPGEKALRPAFLCST